MKIKIYFIFFIMLSLSPLTNILSMHELMMGWADTLGKVLIGKPLKSVLLELHSQQTEPFNFTSLNKDIQLLIIDLLTRNSIATNLTEASSTIHNLANVNKELDEKINEPRFCLQIIKYLSQKFNKSNYDVASALRTRESQRRVDLQKRLWNGIFGPYFIPSTQKRVSLGELSDFVKNLKSEGADLSFTYTIPDEKPFYEKTMFRITTILEHAWTTDPNNTTLLESITNAID